MESRLENLDGLDAEVVKDLQECIQRYKDAGFTEEDIKIAAKFEVYNSIAALQIFDKLGPEKSVVVYESFLRTAIRARDLVKSKRLS